MGDLGGSFPQGLSDDMARLYMDLATALNQDPAEEEAE